MKSVELKLKNIAPISIHSFDEWNGLLILDGDSYSASVKRAAATQFPSWLLCGLNITFGSGSARILDRPASSDAFYLNGKYYYRVTGRFLDGRYGQRGLSYKRKVDGIRRLVYEVMPVVDAKHVSIITEALTREIHKNTTKTLETINHLKLATAFVPSVKNSSTYGEVDERLRHWTQCSSILKPMEIERFVGPALSNKQAS